ncbi:MAG: ArsA-related P-loop ATPase [Pseudomonadota bacterium]
MTLFEKRLVIVCGKGGVGRTTVAAALATALARRGKRILLAHVRSKQRLGQLLDYNKPIGDKIQQIEPNLWVVNMNPTAAIREIGLMVLRYRTLYRAVLENRLVKHFLRAIPALEQYSMLGKVWYHTTEKLGDQPKYHSVVFDGPATGHLLSMLRIPQAILDTVPSGPLTRDAQKAQDLLSDPTQTSLWAVTLAEEMSVSETIDLCQTAKDELHIAVERIIVNAVYPADFEKDPQLADALSLLGKTPIDPQLNPMLFAAETIYKRRKINRHYIDTLAKQLSIPITELRDLFVRDFDRNALNILSKELESAIGR